MIGGDEADSAHVGGQVIHLVDPTSNCQQTFVEFSQVQNLEFVCARSLILRLLNVGSPNPMAFRFQPLHEMVPNKSSRAGYQDAIALCHVFRPFLLKMFCSTPGLSSPSRASNRLGHAGFQATAPERE